MEKIKSVTLWIFALSLGVAVVLGGDMLKPKKTISLISPEVSQQVTNKEIKLVSPNLSRLASIASLSGVVSYQAWDKDEPATPEAGLQINQGDEVITKAKSGAIVVVEGIAEINIGEGADVVVPSLLPNQTTIRQRGGEIRYSLTGSEILNISVNRTLIELSSGTVVVSYAGQITRVTLLTGEAKVGYSNNSYITKVWKLRTGGWFVSNDVTGRISTTGKLLTGN